MKKKKQKLDLFEEIDAGLTDIGEHYDGKLTLRTFDISEASPPMDAKLFKATRESLNMSQGVFARVLKVPKRTLEGWEHGNPINAQVAVLVHMIREYPDTISRIEAVTEKARADRTAQARPKAQAHRSPKPGRKRAAVSKTKTRRRAAKR